MRPRRLGLLASVVVGVLAGAPTAQLRLRPVADLDGRVGLELMVRRLATTGTFMMVTAHPDDENNGLLARLTWGEGIRTVLATATRGEGGQNEIGPELFDALAVLRTEELMAAHRFDGAEQYFTRAVDFGYSFSVEETLARWGHEEILADYVRLIRTLRPDVIAALRPDGEGGGQHHQASARLAREAFRAAADPTRFPEQRREGLRPWQARKFYFSAGFGAAREAPPIEGGRLVTVDLARTDPLLGRSDAELGSEARSMHRSQGMPQLLVLPGQAGPGSEARYYLVDEVAVAPTSPPPAGRRDVPLFEGIDISIPGLVRFVPGSPPVEVTAGLEAVQAAVAEAAQALERRGPGAAAAPLAAGLQAVRTLRARLGTMAGLDEAARAELASRLDDKATEFERALLLAAGVRLEALADDGVVTPGQRVPLTLLVANAGPSPVLVKGVDLRGFDGADAPCPGRQVAGGGVFACTTAVSIPRDAPVTTPYFRQRRDAARYDVDPDAPFGWPFRPTPFRVRVDLEIPTSRGPASLAVARPVEYRYEDLVAGEKRMELHVVPAFAVRTSPPIVIFPVPPGSSNGPAADRTAPAPRELRVTVVNGARGAGAGEVSLEVPAGWTVTPPSVPVQFSREDEARTVRFMVQPPAGVAPGNYRLGAVVRAGGARFDRGYQVVDYPHIRRRHLVVPAEATAKVLDLAVAPDLTVGYIMGAGDEVPQAIEQLGARVVLLGPDDLAWGDLDRFDAIVTGIRAYERRPDLRAHNDRVLRYVERGGTLIVQYNRPEWQYGPYPARIGRDRVTDETAPVRVLVPDHPLLTQPNRIGEAAWQGWVQERGLYFLDAQGRDPRYVDLVSLEDPFEYNRGVKTGALVEARYGQGRWVYVALGLWRQLPAGTSGAYQLLANLVSLGKRPPRSLQE